jgi:hypothetical protein
MGVVKSFFDELASFITIETEVAEYGSELTEGESFLLNIRISNSTDVPSLRFQIQSCKVFKTANAAPLQYGAEKDFVEALMFVGEILGPNAGVSDSVPMRAKHANPEPSSQGALAKPETVARVEVKGTWLTADLSDFKVNKKVIKNIKPS